MCKRSKTFTRLSMATADHHNAIEKTSVIVVIVPFPVHSHSNQLLQLSALISSYNVPVHYAGSASDNSQVRARASHGLNLSEIHFHDFPIPPFVPHPTKIPTEKFLLPYFHAVEQLREPVGDLLRDLSTKAERIIVIHDSISSSAVQDVSSIKNAESYTFQATTAFSILCFVSLEFGSKFLPIPKEAEIVSSDNPIEIPSTEGAFSYETANFIANQQQFMRYAVGDLYNGCRLIDGAFLDHFVKNIQNNIKKAWSIGPLHQYAKTENGIGNSINGRDKCLEWLEKQEPDSVLYISFGTTIYMADHDRQLKELAIALERSETKFIWVFRSDADNKKEEEILPQGFEERVKGVGMVVKDWAPQLEILNHPSTGGFLSHCGWNSTLESISYGVPVAAWPLHSDQPMNALFITEVLKTGVNVKEWARRDQVVSSSEISKVLRRLMGSEEGDEIRKRAKELGAKVRSATDDGGVSRLECDSFIAHITR
ncbi:zeatin O-glucosyltransferase [Ziziphus jujuba]|uniref:Glycosyltransferase n=1 Tax=Ziziphus jujuba TaxID=326968 RepID=A0A6P3ZTJ9_ZIZJJ|nr:zeatin O-glucosyltransferase [Ziziphus jujuba]